MPLTYEWKDHGMKLYIPADALKPDTPSLTMTIQASLSGQYQLPDDTELVSGVYWIAFPRRFSQPVTLELQHCADIEHPDQLSSLSFLTAKCNQKTLPYEFRPLSGGTFPTNSCYGSIELDHFSAFGIGWVWGKEKKKCYTAQVFYIPQPPTTWLMHFTIYCDLELYLKVCICYFGGFSCGVILLFNQQEVKQIYSEQGAEAGPFLAVTFDGDEVSLDIPEKKITLPCGWSIEPLVPPRVRR